MSDVLLPASCRYDAQPQSGRAKDSGETFQLWIASPGQGAIERLSVEAGLLGDVRYAATCFCDIPKRMQQVSGVTLGERRLNVCGRVLWFLQPRLKMIA